MQMLKKLHDPQKGKLRIVGMVSGSGKSLVSIIERQKELANESKDSFEVVGIFTDNPSSLASAIGKKYNLPVFINDIRKFYHENKFYIKNFKAREIYDRATLKMISNVNGNLLVFAGYVWVATYPLINSYLIINAHPADLTVMKDGKRAYAGADGIGDALRAGERFLRSSVHLVTEDVDGGPLLSVSKPIPVEDDLNLEGKVRWRKYLKLVNQAQRQLLVFAVEKIAEGNFESDDSGNIYYLGEPIPRGIQL
jgi:folate-dependent phosphoribosylglycinamide formyltransferase PurN